VFKSFSKQTRINMLSFAPDVSAEPESKILFLGMALKFIASKQKAAAAARAGAKAGVKVKPTKAAKRF
jgi:hypothetical protein